MNRLQRVFIPSRDHVTPLKSMIIKTGLCMAIFIIGPGIVSADTREKILLGAVERVVLLPWGVTLPARIDTGAATSSLDARNIAIKGNHVEFTLPEQRGGHQIRLPIARWATVRSAGTKGKRPVVVIEMCIGSKKIRTEVNLNDRSRVKYPLLIGRNTLKMGFVVGCDTSYCAPPSCLEATSK